MSIESQVAIWSKVKFLFEKQQYSKLYINVVTSVFETHTQYKKLLKMLSKYETKVVVVGMILAVWFPLFSI